jgi:hypothetical protein
MFETMSFTNMIHFLKRPTLPQCRARHFGEHLTLKRAWRDAKNARCDGNGIV